MNRKVLLNIVLQPLRFLSILNRFMRLFSTINKSENKKKHALCRNNYFISSLTRNVTFHSQFTVTGGGIVGQLEQTFNFSTQNYSYRRIPKVILSGFLTQGWVMMFVTPFSTIFQLQSMDISIRHLRFFTIYFI